MVENTKFSVGDDFLVPKIYLGGNFLERGILLLDNDEQWIKHLSRSIGKGKIVAIPKAIKDSLTKEIVKFIQVNDEDSYLKCFHNVYTILYKLYHGKYLSKFNIVFSKETENEFNNLINSFTDKANIEEVKTTDLLEIRFETTKYIEFDEFINKISSKVLLKSESIGFNNLIEDRSLNKIFKIINFISTRYFRFRVFDKNKSDDVVYLDCYVEVKDYEFQH